MPEDKASVYAKAFAHVVRVVKPDRGHNRDRQRRERWWLLGRSGAQYREAVAKLTRFIVTPETAKHRIFVWLHASIFPEHKLYVIARDDDTSFGILQGRFHEVWALRLGSRHGDGIEGGRPRYTNTRCFETFPFPLGLTPNLPAISYVNNPHSQAIAAAARELVEKRDAWLNPPDLVERVPEVVPGFPDRIIPRNPKAAAILKTRTLTTSTTCAAHARARGSTTCTVRWMKRSPPLMAGRQICPDNSVLERLLELNRARAAG